MFLKCFFKKEKKYRIRRMNGNKIPYHFVCFLYNFIYLYHNTVPYYRFPNFLESIDLFSVTVALRVVSCNSNHWYTVY